MVLRGCLCGGHVYIGKEERGGWIRLRLLYFGRSCVTKDTFSFFSPLYFYMALLLHYNLHPLYQKYFFPLAQLGSIVPLPIGILIFGTCPITSPPPQLKALGNILATPSPSSTA